MDEKGAWKMRVSKEMKGEKIKANYSENNIICG